MGVENLLYRYDKTKFRVISGDVQYGYWSLDGYSLVRAPECCGSRNSTENPINLERNILSVQVSEVGQANTTGSILGAGVGAMAGLRYYGFVGAIGGAFAGHFLGGGSPEIRVEVELTDGRKFVASMSPALYKRFSAIANRD